MKVRVEADEWSPDGRKILSAENIEAIRKALEDEGPIIVEHWHYYGSRSPDRFVFDDLDDFMEYVQGKARLAMPSTFGVSLPFAGMRMKLRAASSRMKMGVCRGKARISRARHNSGMHPTPPHDASHAR
jgi:hypothetical protein